MENKQEIQIIPFNGKDKREFFRIDTMLPFSCDHICHQHGELSEKSALTPEIDLSPNDINAKLLNAIKAMDSKLNFIIRALCQEYEIDNVFETKEEKEINISASGMRFQSKDKYNTGDLLRVNIELPYPYRMLSVMGKVVRVEKIEENGQVYYNIAISFIALDEDKQSNLLKYLFDIQRKTLKETASPHI